MCSTEIDYTYLISQQQDAEAELKQHDARLTRLERAVLDLALSTYKPRARHILETPVSEFITT